MTELFDSSVYARRISQAALAAASAGLSGLVIGTGPELAYLTGSWISSHERLTALVIPAAAQPVIVAPAVDRSDLAHSALPELDVDLSGWVDGDDPHQLVVDALGEDGPVALGSSLTADHVLKIQEKLGERKTVLATSALKELFMRKDADEIEQLRLAGRAIDAVHAEVPGLLRAGRTEAEVAADLEKLILAEHDVVDFIIVGSGPNGADPHHSFSDRELNEHEPVVIDIGGTYGVGYHSDCTRTYVVGGTEGVAEEFTGLYQVLFDAQEAACAAVRPGVTAESIDQIARDHIAAAGYGEYYIHRTGHGIGLSTHEEPFIMAGNDLVLEEGMAFSVEPGIYLPGKFGARIEDILTVTAEGAEYLTRQPRVLQ
ncbi:M24 family metallopeptidase [Corynebacterium halotolerans]|uniref:M24 family metallopeptidase n=1 Tax=Corynebacterium halotolerans TaxID=225326 RepID=UPI003CF0E30C